MVDGQNNTYTYDSRNRLVETNRGGALQSMAYDPDRARIQKSVGGVTTDYLIDANRDYAQVLVETNGSTTLSYTYGTDLVALETGSNSYTYHTDALGSTRVLTDSAGMVADDIRYDAWGDRLSGGDVAENQYLFAGEQFDAGLDQYYLRARYYDQGIGRFTQQDPYRGREGEPATLHKYIYTHADPVNNIDPTGNFSLSSFGTASNIRGILTTTSVRSFSSAIGRAVTSSLPTVGRVTGKAALRTLRQ